jgi:hypothetical protein
MQAAYDSLQTGDKKTLSELLDFPNAETDSPEVGREAPYSVRRKKRRAKKQSQTARHRKSFNKALTGRNPT